MASTHSLFQTMLASAICIVITAQNSGSALPVFLVRADHYNAGLLVGKTFQKQIQEYYHLHPSLRSKYIPWIKTPLGKQVYEEYVEVANRTFPQYTLEMLGIANGAGLPFEEVFLINSMRELDAFLNVNSSVDSCSDVFINTGGNVGYCHNEDASPLIVGRGYIIDAEIYYPGSPQEIVEKFTFYTYPGTLSGNAFGFNGHGLTFSVDALYPKIVLRKKIPRNILTRAMLAARSLEEVEKILSDSGSGSAYAVGINIGDTSSGKLYNVEVGPDATRSPGSLLSTFEVKPTTRNDSANYFHVNKFRRLSLVEIPEHVISSKHRTARIEQLIPADTFSQVRGILGDTADKDYPLYRRPIKTDPTSTVATACYDIQKKTMDVYMGNPKSSPVFHSFPIRRTL